MSRSISNRIHARWLKEFEEKHGDAITSLTDFTAGDEPTNLFYLWIKLFGYLMCLDAEASISKKGIKRRKLISPLIRKVAPATLSNKQVFENRNALLAGGNADGTVIPEDKGIVLPDEPVIWVSNHAFKDDTLASILALKRQATILFGSLPQFFNTPDGFTGWMIGVAMVNRNNKNSRRASMDKLRRIIACGGDVFMFPEGVWNVTPNQLMIDLWPGVYRLAKETGAKIVPVAHYINDCCAMGNPDVLIHTVVDDPFRIDDLPEREALELIRTKLCTWFYLMMEKYGQSMREAELAGFENVNDAWTKKVEDRIKTVGYYDTELEKTLSYDSPYKINPEDVWAAVAESEHDPNRFYARALLKERETEDFQKRY